MALTNKRIIDLPERATLNSDDYTVVDGSNGGTAKYKITDVGSIPELEERITDAEGDITDIKEDLTQKATVIVNTSDEAEVVTFADGADDMLMKSVVLKLVPHQEGTGDPSPDNVRPISGYTSVNVTRAGKNLFDIGKVITNTGRVTNHGDGTLTIQTASNSASTAALDPSLLKNYADLKAGKTYILSAKSTGTNKFIYLGGANVRWDFGTAKTITSAMLESKVYFYASGASSSATLSDIQIELGSTATTYDPYTAETYPITIPSSTGTVYGGELDVVNGTLKVTYGQIASYSGQSINTPWISSKDVYASGRTPTTGAQVVYPLTEQTDITLDPVTIKTLLGSNTIWMNADGTIQCDYPADTKLYIDALTAPDDDMIADSNIASGKYFTINNRLYLSTSAIAQGEAIVVGTNCTQTDLATALNALNA